MTGVRNVYIVIILLAAALLFTAGCNTNNVGPEQTIQNTLAVTVPAGMTGGADSTWRVTWSGGTTPYTIAMDMGGGTTADVAAGTAATSPFDQLFTMVGGTFTYTITVSDSGTESGTVSGSYTVASGNLPVIDNVDYTMPVLTVDVSSPLTGATLTVTVTEPTGLSADAASKVAAQSSGTAAFTWSATDAISGGSGDTTITVDDGQGGTATATATITVPGLGLLDIPAGALAAVPLASAATTADTVTVVVITGDTPNPFQYMNGVGVTVESGAAFVDGTYNVGAVGGAQLDPDGFWAGMSPVPDSFLIPSDFMIQESDIGGGLVRIDFNVTPINGSEATDSGELFNFELDFASAGTYNLGFEEFHDVKRTYFSDTDSTEYNWDDISNDYTDVPNSIEVT